MCLFVYVCLCLCVCVCVCVSVCCGWGSSDGVTVEKKADERGVQLDRGRRVFNLSVVIKGREG